jgi:hypothetical protein
MLAFAFLAPTFFTALRLRAQDSMATLDYDEFCECLCRCADAKYGEIKMIPPDAGLRGLLENLFCRSSDEAIIRDATYIYAERYDWAESRPLKGQPLSLHRRWRDCWQCMELADLHHFPLWEKGVHDVLQVRHALLRPCYCSWSIHALHHALHHTLHHTSQLPHSSYRPPPLAFTTCRSPSSASCRAFSPTTRRAPPAARRPRTRWR